MVYEEANQTLYIDDLLMLPAKGIILIELLTKGL